MQMKEKRTHLGFKLSVPVFIFCYLISTGQPTFIKWINNIEDTEAIRNLKEISQGKYLCNYMRKNLDYSLSQNAFAYSSTLYFLNYEGTFTDSLSIEKLDNYYIIIQSLIKSEDNELLFYCNALNSITLDIQLCLLKTDQSLNVLNYNFFGSENSNEFIYNFCINSNNNIVFVGSNDYSYVTEGYLLWELDITGNTVQYKVDNTYLPFAPDIFQMSGSGKYYVIDNNGLLIYNTNFELDAVLTINSDSTGFSSFPQKHKLINDFQYLKTGMQNVYNGTGPPEDPYDMAFLIMDEYYQIVDEHLFGVPDTLDFPRNIDWIDTNRIFFSGVKNYITLPPEDSWLSLYITNLQGEIIHAKYYGGYGLYTVGTGLATSDGGYIIASSWFDFANYIPPGPIDWDVIIMKVDADGLISNVETPMPFKVTNVIVYPNPVKNELHFDLGLYSNLQLSIYNSTGERIIFQSLLHSQTIDISSFPSGMYVYLLTGKNGFTETGKIIKY
jgi:hypothetical protein